MNLEREKAIKKVNSKSNEIIERFINGKFSFKGVTKSQFATLEDMLYSIHFALESPLLKEFIKEKITKEKCKDFFQDILKNYVDKYEEILEFLHCENEEPKVKKRIFREIFYLIKITFRKENVVKIVENFGEDK